MTGPSDPDLRVKALEHVLVEKGFVDPAALDVIAEAYEHNIGPHNGARVVARAWCDPDYRKWLLEDGTAAIAALGYSGRGGETIRVVENTPQVHNVIVCTLCSCYPWPVLGLPPSWYKSPAYRSRVVVDPRGVLLEFGVELPADTEIRVWDSTSEIRYLVAPMRPPRTDGWAEEALARLVTRDSMIGTGLPDPPGEPAPVNGPHDVGGLHGSGPVQPDPDEPVFHHAWEKRILALHVGLGLAGAYNLDEYRHARETLPPAEFLAASYYETVVAGVERMVVAHGLVAPDELASGRSRRTSGRSPRPLAPDAVADALRRGRPSGRDAPRPARCSVGDAPRPARFSAGDTVRAKDMHPVTHTRLPRYARGHVGVVTALHGCHALPDSRAHGRGDDPQWLYTVRFAGTELWGPAADPTLSVSIDAFEPYLEDGT